MTEQALIDDMIAILKEKMEKDYARGSIKRDAHPKDLGLLKATFTVEKNIPKEAMIGVFATPKTYNCLIRLSNSSSSVQSDKEKDFRGMAIKLIGVAGERCNMQEKQTQDFVLLSNPTMPLGTVQLFRDAVYYTIKWNIVVLAAKFLWAGNKSVLLELQNSRKNDASSLDIRYWSTTPYQFGNTSVKYSIVPTTTTYKSTLPNPLTDTYLSDNNASHLKNSVASFDFLVQFFKSEHLTPTEHAGIEWKENTSPFIKMATIHIPKQIIFTEERKVLAEILSFSPSNALKIHAPIGGLNRARAQVYEQLSAFRHSMNNKPLVEPNEAMFKALV
jgi:hypothetical protein